jgi:hypothetical protein
MNTNAALQSAAGNLDRVLAGDAQIMMQTAQAGCPTEPDLSQPDSGELWSKIELAKRRLVSQLLALGLPLKSRSRRSRRCQTIRSAAWCSICCARRRVLRRC